MSDLPTREAACRFLGIPDRELVDILDSPAGVIYVTSDGNSLIDVPADQPDADGKTGLMYASEPDVPGGYRGDFPVFTNPPADDEAPAEAQAPTAAEPSKDELLARARELGIDASSRWGVARLAEEIAKAEFAAAPAAVPGDEVQA